MDELDSYNDDRPDLEEEENEDMAGTKETIFVEAKSQYSVKSNGKWYSPGRSSGLTLDQFERGKSYDVITEEWAKNGKSGMNILQLLGQNSTAPAPSSSKPRDFDAEAKGKTRCAQFEAALQSPILGVLPGLKTAEDVIAFATKLADAGVAYTFRKEEAENV